jgi:hypothetical protein
VGSRKAVFSVEISLRLEQFKINFHILNSGLFQLLTELNPVLKTTMCNSLLKGYTVFKAEYSLSVQHLEKCLSLAL